MPNEYTLFHGTDGDSILGIIRDRSMRPDPDGLVYFSERFDDALQHGADRKRGASFAFKASVTVPAGASLTRTARAGNPYAVVIKTLTPLPVRITELYARLGRVGQFGLKTVLGIESIKSYLQSSKEWGTT